jgi:hypothetical protein
VVFDVLRFFVPHVGVVGVYVVGGDGDGDGVGHVFSLLLEVTVRRLLLYCAICTSWFKQQ